MALRAGKIYAGTSPVSGKWRLSAQHPPRSRSGKRRGARCWLLSPIYAHWRTDCWASCRRRTVLQLSQTVVMASKAVREENADDLPRVQRYVQRIGERGRAWKNAIGGAGGAAQVGEVCAEAREKLIVGLLRV